MVPASVVPVAAIPLTPNGKVDRKQLALLKPAKTKRTKVLAPASPTEEILVKLWQEMLGHQPISVTDNFFELGGHSLIMIRLLHRMRGEGLILQLRELYQYQTIREQAKVIQQMTVAEIPSTVQSTGHTQPTDRPLVAAVAPANRHLLLLQATGEGSPIFIVPGSNGISEGYDELAAEFAAVCPVYGIQMQGVFEGEKPLTDIRQIAALHNRWIREVQPSGPYRLIGHSFGAHVVYEMAHQLQQQGELIECIAMLDRHPQKRRIRIEDPVTFAWKAVAKMFTTYQWTLTGSEADLAAMEASLSGEDVMTNFHQIAAWIAQTQPDPHGAIAHGLRLLQLTLTHMFLDYKLLGRLKSPLIIARAAEASWQEWGEDLGWGKRTSQVMPLLVPGDHFSMIKGDGARVLGEFIKKRLG